MPVMPPGPPPGLSFNGVLQRSPVLRPFPRVPQGPLPVTTQDTVSITAPDFEGADFEGVHYEGANFEGAHYSPHSDSDAALFHSPSNSAAGVSVFEMLGIARRFNRSDAEFGSSTTDRSEVSRDAGASQGEKSGKVSLLETMFREVARVAAESQTQAVVFKEVAATLPRHPLAATNEDGNPAETAKQADAATGVLTTGHAVNAGRSPEAMADPGAAAIARQIISPMLELARDLAKRETRTLRLQLRPEKFGQINLQITRGGDGRLSAQLAANLTGTQQALADGINHLRDTLEQSGLAIDRLEVNLALDLQGKAGGQATPEESPPPVYGKPANAYSAEPAQEARNEAEDKQRRLLNLQI